MGLAMPMSQISLDTIYSKVVNNADQVYPRRGKDDIAAFSEYYAGTGRGGRGSDNGRRTPLCRVSISFTSLILFRIMFSSFGQGLLWICNGAITLVGILFWLAFFPRLSSY